MAAKRGRKRKKNVTIHDVGRHAGVSHITVSRVINSDAWVKEETRARVLASLDALGYVPNIDARSLASAEPVRIGFVYAASTAPYIDQLLIGTLAQARKLGCQVTVRNCLEPGAERKVISELVRDGVKGIILPAPLCDSEAALVAVADAQLPCVLVASGRPAPGFSAVSIDDFQAAREMTRYLLSLGHQRIAFINGHPEQTAAGQRFRGYLEAMAEAGIKVGPERVAQGYFTYRSGLEAAEILLADRSLTAIFAANDEMAAAAMAVAHRKAMDVPGDVTIAGFDDTPLATMISPHLTTVRRPVADMAYRSVKLLISDIENRRFDARKPATRDVLEYTILPRGSSGPLPSSS